MFFSLVYPSSMLNDIFLIDLRFIRSFMTFFYNFEGVLLAMTRAPSKPLILRPWDRA